MAKKKITHPLHMHVPAKIGFSVLAIAVMVYGAFLASASNSSNQTQTAETHASSTCSAIHGTCQNANTQSCEGGKKYYTGYCPGAANIRCCAPANHPTPFPTGGTTRCAQVFHGGTCLNKNTHGCAAGFRVGYCPGASNIQCCP